MQRLSFTLVGAVLCAGVLAWPGTPQDRTPRWAKFATDEEKQVQAILAAKDPSRAASDYGALFKSATTEDLRRLQMNSSDTIAIQAAWEEVEQTVPVKPDQVVRPDREKLTRFLGFLEGRARVRAPEWWAEALLDARANRRGNLYAGGLNIGERRASRTSAALPRSATFDSKDGKPVVRLGAVSVPVAEDLRDKLKGTKFFDGVSALITSSHCYIAAYDDVGYPYRLACVERASAKTLWVTEVWESWWANATGQHRQWVEVTEQGDRIVVFGVASAGFHVEAFRADDGVNVLRFSNSYSRW
jgi:hypothetical protein